MSSSFRRRAEAVPVVGSGDRWTVRGRSLQLRVLGDQVVRQLGRDLTERRDLGGPGKRLLEWLAGRNLPQVDELVVVADDRPVASRQPSADGWLEHVAQS
jgi:hypothetical protein